MVFNYIIICICILFLFLLHSNKLEHLVNLDEERKKKLKKCSEKEKCYDKPPFLHGNCQENKSVAAAQVNEQYKQMFTKEEYNKLKDNIDYNVVEPTDYQDVIIPTIPEDVNEQVSTDVTDMLPGYNAEFNAQHQIIN